MKQVLFLSVGGRPQPLKTSIEGARWDRVVFVVSDGSDGTQSSRVQVESPEIVYNPKTGARGPGLKHLEACPRDNACIAVPPDDLDRALALIDSALEVELAAEHKVTVDYTGGTKTMTAAMVLAGSAREGVVLRFMAGRRHDLVQVEAGTERPVKMPGYLLGVANLFALVRAQVRRRAYGQGLAILSEIKRGFMRAQKDGLPGAPKRWRQRAEAWSGYLSVLDAWDRFEVTEATRLMNQALDRGVKWAMALERDGFAARLRALAAECSQGAGPALCEDLWLNAERRAALGLYDDAIARLYRLAEASVQARLAQKHGIPDTGRVPVEKVPSRLREQCEIKQDPRTGAEIVVLPLFRALEMLAALDPDDPLVAVWPRDANGFQTPAWQQARNRSILAHGFRPLRASDWEEAKQWFEERRSALWEDLLGRPTAKQLPNALP